MANVYKIGDSQNPISLKVNIHGVGAAASKATAIPFDDNGGAGVVVARSSEATGDIDTVAIGDYRLLKGKLLGVATQVSPTDNIDGADQASTAPFGGIYTLTGGDDGEKTFTDATITPKDSGYLLNFLILLS